MVFYIVWAVCTVVGVWRILRLLSEIGRVGNDDRLMIFFALTPFSLLLTPILLIIEFMFWAGKKLDEFRESPKYVSWSIQRKIRKRWRGPVVRIVEYMHKKRKEKASEEDLPEV